MNPEPVWRNVVDCWERAASSGSPLRQRAETIMEKLRLLESPVVAFSGGVDSSVVAGLLTIARQESIELVTAVGPALAKRQREFAGQVAGYLGARHRWIDAREIDDPGYQANATNRCFYCKSQLYRALQSLGTSQQTLTLLNGTNADDLQDHRPGLQAANRFSVVAPLAEAGLDKSQVRNLATMLGLPTANLPAAPCLASRIQYGIPVTPTRLKKIEAAEQQLWEMGFSDVRVRLLDGEIASVEVPRQELSRLSPLPVKDSLEQAFRRLGFNRVQIQPEGLRSGRLNDLVALSHHDGGTGTGPRREL